MKNLLFFVVSFCLISCFSDLSNSTSFEDGNRGEILKNQEPFEKVQKTKALEKKLALKQIPEIEVSSMSSACELDWDYSYHNNDGDYCINVRMVFNGLVGDCDGCSINSMTITLNENGAIPGVGPVLIGKWTYNNLQNYYEFIDAYESSAYPALYKAVGEEGLGNNSSLGNEIVDFDYHLGSGEDISLCVEYRLVCPGGSELLESCQEVDLYCW